MGVLPPRHHEDGGVCREGHGLLLDILHVRVPVLDGVCGAQLLHSIPEGFDSVYLYIFQNFKLKCNNGMVIRSTVSNNLCPPSLHTGWLTDWWNAREHLIVLVAFKTKSNNKQALRTRSCVLRIFSYS